MVFRLMQKFFGALVEQFPAAAHDQRTRTKCQNIVDLMSTHQNGAVFPEILDQVPDLLLLDGVQTVSRLIKQ